MCYLFLREISNESSLSDKEVEGDCIRNYIKLRALTFRLLHVTLNGSFYLQWRPRRILPELGVPGLETVVPILPASHPGGLQQKR